MFGENTALSEKREDGAGRTPSVLCDRFVLETRLDQGRLGTMYRAVDRLRRQDGRSHVGVLILPSEIARNPEQLAAFERELEAVRMLSHPNIVRIFSLERDGDTTFLVVEWVDGESLRAVMDSLAPETVCEADALGVVRAVGNALVYAHARGLVHGDVRPENVLVTERGEVRLLFVSACFARTAPFTVGPRDDVRGLAALAYELMSGSPPPIGGLYPRGKSDEPEPIEGLSRKRWKALKSALSIRDGRVASVRKLLAALDLPEPRAPRRGSRPDRIRDARGGVLKRLVIAGAICAGIVAFIAGGLRIWNERADELPDLSGLPATVGAGAGRAAELTREGLSGAKERLERAGSRLAALWSDVGERVDAESAAADANADDVIPSTDLFEREDRNGSGPVPEDGALEQSRAAGTSDATSAFPDQPASANDAPRPDEPSVAGDEQQVAAAPAPDEAGAAPDSEQTAGDDQSFDDGPSATRISFSRAEYIVSESGGVAAIEVERGGAQGDASFVWWTRDASARSGDDYADLGRTVEQFGNGETVRVLYVPITSDSIVEERREYFEIHLGLLSDEGNQNGTLQSARVTIVDDDR